MVVSLATSMEPLGRGNEVDVCAASGADAPGETRTLWNDQEEIDIPLPSGYLT